MTKLQKGLAVLGIAVVLLGLGFSAVKAAGNDGSFLSDIKKLVAQEIVDRIFGVSSNSSEAIIGSAQTTALHAVAETVTNIGGLFLWDTDSNSGLEVKGPTWLSTLNVSSSVVISGTSTLGYTPNQLNTPQVAFNSNSTTLCSVQNTSGVDRIITSATLGITGSTGNGGLSQFRGYVSAGRADMNAAATSSLLSQTFLAITATGKMVVGGPVPNSYFSSSTAGGTIPLTFNGLVTSTPVLWANGWYANVTSTAITSSTGNCMFASYPL